MGTKRNAQGVAINIALFSKYYSDGQFKAVGHVRCMRKVRNASRRYVVKP
jgi:hypothetical protein